MAKLRPFQGILYNSKVVENIGDAITLPYDKISAKQFKIYQDRCSYSMVNLILGEDLEGDTGAYNKYTRSADYLEDWLGQQILKQDTADHLYVYEQEFVVPDSSQVKRRTALIGLVELQEFDKKIILPHERTLAGPKADRLKLMQATGMNYGQIFGLYKDSEKTIAQVLERYKQAVPYFDVKTPEEGVRHRLWVLDRKNDQEILLKTLADKQVYIADGHHRYSTAIIYRDELRKQVGAHSDDAYNYCLMSLVAVEDDGLVILPTHRVVKGLQHWDSKKFLNTLSDYFEIESFAKRERVYFLETLNKVNDGQYLGLSLGDDLEYYLLKLRDNAAVRTVLKDKSACLQELDVTVLHQIILHHILGMTEEDMEKQTYLSYFRSVEQALDESDEGQAQATFVLRPTAVKQVLQVADQGQYMPQKSTDFFPKLFTGVVCARVHQASTVKA